ncbi:single-stranded DNA-binding protein [Thermaurantimonas aggregans]|uniref:Single-stranded DNA-binding protein n=1 Tax=Thermaurantimonas aggregans TaxID=2173829 RepID=A0A401XN77_9FLAO|nr:single-stranded DNA-binding protein [Thermaurantimonas aggregans]MCX8148490.1 single-stranded DNA-binding protein [Thermaurantimonas aggregans]GCD78474.1 single-stranded DNA-binding protein [Thermaurantimonas aggregans]
MSGSLNKVMIIGNLGADPEYKTLENNATVAKLRIATTESYMKDGQKVENTEWHTVNLWRNLADTAHKYLKKGDKVYIEGKLKTRSWEENGQKRYSTEIEGLSMVMLGSSRSGTAQSSPTAPSIQQEAPEVTEIKHDSTTFASEPENDDLPF